MKMRTHYYRGLSPHEFYRAAYHEWSDPDNDRILSLVLKDVGPFLPKTQLVEVAYTGHAPALMNGAQIDLVRKWIG